MNETTLKQHKLEVETIDFYVTFQRQYDTYIRIRSMIMLWDNIYNITSIPNYNIKLHIQLQLR